MRLISAFILTLLGSLFAALPAVASTLKLEDGTRVAVEITKGTTDDVFVLVNGLVYATDRWDDVASALSAEGATVIRFALPGQPENLRLLKRSEEPKHFAHGLELSQMAENLRLILKAAHITKRVHLVGLSYGASVAATFAKTNSDLVADVTFVSPLVVPTDEYDSRGAALRQWLDGIRYWENSPCALYGAINPYLCVGQDFWFDGFYKAIYGSYVDGRIQDVPEGIEPAIYKKAIFHLIRAARDFDLKKEIKGLRNVSMFVGGLEEENLAADQKLAWKNVPAKERGEFVVFQGSHHALPDEAPEALAEELLKVARTAR